jgi:hypothetical protein
MHKDVIDMADATPRRTGKPDVRSDGGVRMHTLHAELPIPYLTPDDISANARTAGAKLSPPMPPPKRLAFYGGLGALAVFGAVDWPVAVAIGAATMVARSGRHDEGDSGGRAEKAARGARKSATAPKSDGRSKRGARGDAKKTAAKA